MIGNDVVDLKLAKSQSNWQRKGYLNKIFTDLEQQQIAQSDVPNESVWELWSRKEAVYKLLLQQGIQRGYYPKKIECLHYNEQIGKVKYNSKLFYTKTYISSDYIHSIAVINELDLYKIQTIFWDKNCIKIDQIPFLKSNNLLLNISKSHHGRFEKVICLNFESSLKL